MQQVLDFLKELKVNNNREWFQAHKNTYESARKEHLQLVASFLEGFASFEPGISKFEPKDCVFRINRDVRFSADKSPYKVNFSAYFNKNGRKSWTPGYYLHIEPGQCFLAGGIWMPESDMLKKIRQEIDYNLDAFTQILNEPTFGKYFKGLQGEKLTRAPKDYPESHPGIEYLKYKSFEVSHPFSDQDLLKPGFVADALSKFKVLVPYNQFLDQAIAE